MSLIPPLLFRVLILYDTYRLLLPAVISPRVWAVDSVIIRQEVTTFVR